MKQIDIKVYSDFICPWCYVGKVRLDRVIKSLENEISIKLDTKPYILYPHIPIGGVPKSDFEKKTKPGMGRSLRKEAEIENIEIKYSLIDRIPNSMEAHRLMALISDLKLKFNISKDIFHAYFQEGKNIEDLEILSEIAETHNTNQEIVKAFADKNNGLEKVHSEITEAKNNFISLVPTIGLHADLNILGLQSADVWENYFRRASKMAS